MFKISLWDFIRRFRIFVFQIHNNLGKEVLNENNECFYPAYRKSINVLKYEKKLINRIIKKLIKFVKYHFKIFFV